MSEMANRRNIVGQSDTDRDPHYYKKEFWSEENLKYSRPHFRLEKSAKLVNRLTRGKECSLLDVGCGPATLRRLISPHIDYYGIDIAIQEPAPNLLEFDFLEEPIRFDDRKFDIVVAQGVFEYVGHFQEQKFAEIAHLLNQGGLFVVSYVNFDHRAREIYWPYSNVRSFGDFSGSLARYFKVQRCFATSHNWRHGEPEKKLIRAVNLHLNLNVPIISPMLAVEYFFVCSPGGPVSE